eukprot:6330253-Amphidinium_carterae.1
MLVDSRQRYFAITLAIRGSSLKGLPMRLDRLGECTTAQPNAARQKNSLFFFLLFRLSPKMYS